MDLTGSPSVNMTGHDQSHPMLTTAMFWEFSGFSMVSSFSWTEIMWLKIMPSKQNAVGVALQCLFIMLGNVFLKINDNILAYIGFRVCVYSNLYLILHFLSKYVYTWSGILDRV